MLPTRIHHIFNHNPQLLLVTQSEDVYQIILYFLGQIQDPCYQLTWIKNCHEIPTETYDLYLLSYNSIKEVCDLNLLHQNNGIIALTSSYYQFKELEGLGIQDYLNLDNLTLWDLERSLRLTLKNSQLRQSSPFLEEEKEFLQINAELEKKLLQKVADYQSINQQLKLEIKTRQIIEDDLEKSKNHLLYLMQNAPLICYILDREGKFTFVKGKALTDLGITTDQMIGRSILDFPENIEDFTSLTEVLSGIEKTWIGTFHNHIFENHITYSCDEQGQINSFFGIAIDITKHYQAEKQLKESEEKFSQLVNNIETVFWLVKADMSQIIYMSPMYEKLWGRSCQEVYENPLKWCESIYPDDQERIANIVARLINSQGQSITQTMEYRLIAGDGSIRWIYAKASPLYDEKGICYRIAGFSQDITAQKEAEDSLKLSKERYTLAISGGRVIVWDLDILANSFYVSPNMRTMLGYREEELPDNCKIWQEVMVPEDYALLDQLYKDYLSGKQAIFSIEYRIKHKNGSLRWFLCQGEGFRDEHNQVYRLSGTATDITEQKLAEIAYRTQEEQLRLLTDALPVCLSYIDKDKRYQFVNKIYEEWFNYNREWIKGKYLWEVIGETAYQSVQPYIERAYKGEKVSYSMKVPYGNKLRYVKGDLIPDLDAENNVRGYYALIADISQQKEIENQLRYRLAIEESLSHFSYELLTQDNLDLDHLLQSVGTTMNCSRVQLMKFCLKTYTCSTIAEWTDENTNSIMQNHQNLPVNNFQWWMGELLDRNNIIINDLEDLPPSANTEKFVLQQDNINSLLAVPIYTQYGTLWGCFRVDVCDYKQKFWISEDAKVLRVMGEMIYTAFDRVETQQKLQASSLLYTSIFAHSTDIIFLLDYHNKQWIYQTVNPAFETATGLNNETIKGKISYDVFNQETAQVFEDLYAHCIKTKKIIYKERNLELNKGLRIWSISLIPIFNEDQEIIKLQGSARDITEEKQDALLQIRWLESERLLAKLVMTIRQSLDINEILQTTVSELCSFFNADRVLFLKVENNQQVKVIQESTYFKNLSVINTTVSIMGELENHYKRYQQGEILVLVDREKESLSPDYKSFLKGYNIRSQLIVPIFVRQIDSVNLSIPLSGEMESTSADQLWGLLCIHQCYSPRHWEQDEIEFLRKLTNQLSIALYQAELLQKTFHYAKELSRSNQELEQFAYIASHDLQEPLNTVSSYTQLLERRYNTQLDERGKRYMYFMLDAVDRMKRQIRDLLEYSRVGRKEKVQENINMRLLLQQVLHNLDHTIKINQAKIIYQNIPDEIQGDPSQLLQLFQNLMSNSLKYRSDSPPQIIIDCSHTDQHYCFSIQDNGIGIDPRHHQRIFQIFQRLHTQQEYPGTGIGLSICQKIVERHGGIIWLESSPQQGSTFYFTIGKNS